MHDAEIILDKNFKPHENTHYQETITYKKFK